MARIEDRASLGGKLLEQVADPQDALWVEPVDRLVEQQHARIAEECPGDPEPLAHAERELADLLLRHCGQTDELEHLVDTLGGDRVRLGDRQQVVSSGSTRMDGLGIDESAYLTKWPAQVVIGPATDGDRPLGGVVQAEDHPHGRGLPGPVGTEEPRDDTFTDLEGQIVDGQRRAVALREAVSGDQRMTASVECISMTLPAVSSRQVGDHMRSDALGNFLVPWDVRP